MIYFNYIYFNSKIGLQIKVGAIRPPKLEIRFNKGLKPSIRIDRPKLNQNRLVAIETTFNQLRTSCGHNKVQNLETILKWSKHTKIKLQQFSNDPNIAKMVEIGFKFSKIYFDDHNRIEMVETKPNFNTVDFSSS